MNKKILSSHLRGVHKKINKGHYTTLGIFVFLFALVSIFFITRGDIPYSSELAYIEHSILGKDAGSVVPASCDSVPPGSHFPGDCVATCPSGVGTYDLYYDPSGSTCPIPLDCTGTPWGTVVHGASVTGYQSGPTVDAPSTCASETRSCWNGTLSGTYANTSCIVKSGTITVPASCVIAVHQSTCTVTADWVSANLDTPRFYDNNTNTTLSNSANGSQTVWVAWGGTTFKLTDSTLYNYDTKTVSASCESGTTWNGSTGQCEYDSTASLSALPTHISYNDDSTLTWDSTHSTSCTPGGAWSNSGTLSGSGSTGALTSTQIYTLQCFGLGSPSPVVSTTVTVCPSNNPTLNKDDITCQPLPTFNVTFTGQYTPFGKFVVNGSNVDSCKVIRTDVNPDTIINSATSVSGSINFTTNFGAIEGTYSVTCSYTDGNGNLVNSLNTFLINYKPIPPKPIVSLKATPINIPAGSQTILSWIVTYPNPVQKDPTRDACTLTAKAVCANGICTNAQKDEETTINTTLSTGKTDIDDLNNGPDLSGGPARLLPTAINTVVNGDIITGDTDWKAIGKKTLSLNHSMDFLLDCRDGAIPLPSNVNESQGVRVLVTSSSER